MSRDDILAVLRGQTSSMTAAFNPEVHAFRNKVIELQKNCDMVKWEQGMGATIPYCKMYGTMCSGQCVFKEKGCPCEGV